MAVPAYSTVWAGGRTAPRAGAPPPRSPRSCRPGAPACGRSGSGSPPRAGAEDPQPADGAELQDQEHADRAADRRPAEVALADVLELHLKLALALLPRRAARPPARPDVHFPVRRCPRSWWSRDAGFDLSLVDSGQPSILYDDLSIYHDVGDRARRERVDHVLFEGLDRPQRRIVEVERDEVAAVARARSARSGAAGPRRRCAVPSAKQVSASIAWPSVRCDLLQQRARCASRRTR